MNQPQITRAQLIAVLTEWGTEQLSTDGLQEWMLDHYDPDEATIGPGEPECVQEAMNIVMNEYELADQAKMLRAQYQLALKFLHCDEDSFISLRSQFLKNAFTD